MGCLWSPGTLSPTAQALVDHRGPKSCPGHCKGRQQACFQACTISCESPELQAIIWVSTNHKSQKHSLQLKQRHSFCTEVIPQNMSLRYRNHPRTFKILLCTSSRTRPVMYRKLGAFRRRLSTRRMMQSSTPQETMFPEILSPEKSRSPGAAGIPKGPLDDRCPA